MVELSAEPSDRLLGFMVAYVALFVASQRLDILYENFVQGIDNFYTLQGWLKGVNASVSVHDYDIGYDGNITGGENEDVARDAYSFTIGYYMNDYHQINYAMNKPEALYEGYAFDGASPNLYNGNIRNIIQNFMNPNDGSPNGFAYSYDQLNRLKNVDVYYAEISNTYRVSENSPRLLDAQPDYGRHLTTEENLAGDWNKYNIRYSWGNGNGTFLGVIPTYNHVFLWETKRNFSREDINSGERTVSKSFNIGTLTYIKFNTYPNPDLLTISDKDGNFVAGTQDAVGNNVAASTISGKFGVIDSRADNSGWISLRKSDFRSVIGTITLTVYTPAMYHDIRENIDKKNLSQWSVTLKGIKSFSFPFLWPQSSPVRLHKN